MSLARSIGVSKLKEFFQVDIRQGSQLDLFIRRFVSNKLAMGGLVLTMVFFIFGIFGPYIAPHDPGSIDSLNRLASPSLEHPFGTDTFGRDVFSRVLIGARISLKVATIVVLSSTFAGVSLGLIAGYYQNWSDELIMRVVDVLFAFPNILLALVIVAILGPGLNKVILALAISYTPVMIRITRSSALAVREEEYIDAAIAYGENDRRIMFREMLPNMVSAVGVQATIIFAFSILSEAGLSYLGFSAQPPTPTWGVIISTGQNALTVAPWVSLFPGLAIMMTVLGLTFLGVGLRDALDPKTDISTEAV